MTLYKLTIEMLLDFPDQQAAEDHVVEVLNMVETEGGFAIVTPAPELEDDA